MRPPGGTKEPRTIRRRATLSRGKARALASHGAGAAAQVPNARATCDYLLLVWRAVGLGTQQVNLRGNRRGVALPR